jgi:hypothetical protein
MRIAEVHDRCDDGDAFLPAELFPMLADVLVRLKAKKMLVELLCANKRAYALCLPSLMRFTHMSTSDGFNAERLTAFAVDGHASRKFAHVKGLMLRDVSLNRSTNFATLETISKSVRNVEYLFWGDASGDPTASTVLWSVLTGIHPPPISIINFGADLRFLTPEMIASDTLELPTTLRTIFMTAVGSEPQWTHLFRILDRLPLLEELNLALHRDPSFESRVILGFPRLLQRLRTLRVIWPNHAQLLSTDNSVREVGLDKTQSEEEETEVEQPWTTLRRLRNLKEVALDGFKSSDLLGLLSVPDFPAGICLKCTIWDLDEAGRREIATLKGVDIEFWKVQSESDEDVDELGFWASLPFAKGLPSCFSNEI